MADHLVDVVNEKDEVIGRELKSRRLEIGFISRVIAIMVMDSRGRVLIVRRAPHKRIEANLHDLVCGNVVSGESYQQAAARELEEELGMRCPLTMLDKYYLENVHEGGTARIFCAAFLGRSDEEPRLNHELVSFRRMSPGEIDSEMRESPGKFTQGFIKEFSRLKSAINHSEVRR
jgi:8-oxo-dGTP pyrophosphatase MutT (NUDIX family)